MKTDILLVNKELPGVNPLFAGEEACSPGHSFGPAVREYYLIHYIVSGKGTFETEGKVFRLGAGDLFLIRPGQWSTYTADARNPWHYIWAGFSSSLDLSYIFDQYVISSERCAGVFSGLLKCQEMGDCAEYFACGKIYEMLAYLGRKQPAEETEQISRYILQAKNFIDTNYAKKITVQMIADALNLNRSYFSTIFKKYVGKSPQAYLLDYRMEKAAFYMTACGYTPKEAAGCCGYTDLFNFSKMFKKRYGISPKTYRALYGKQRPSV